MTVAARIALLTADWFEESEILYPQFRLRGAGCNVKTYSPGGTPIRGKGGLGPLPVDGDARELLQGDFDALLIPGGFAPDIVRRSPEVLALVKEVVASGKPIGFICHGLWVALSAGILEGRNVTAVPVIRPEVEAAGALWSDARVVVDGNIITAQVPLDLEPWMQQFLAAMNSSQSLSATV